ncbi:MAG: endonuclease NucS domain-containing protein [Phycisphaeraceae bacterium]
MKNYYRVLLGAGSKLAEECIAGNFIGAGYGITHDLTGRLPDQWHVFNKEFIPIYLASHPAKTKIAAGLACGMVWTVSKGIQTGDNVVCPDGSGRYRVGEVIGDYVHAAGEKLPHRRPVRWLPVVIDLADTSEELEKSILSRGMVCNLSRSGHSAELERLIGGVSPIIDPIDGKTIDDLANFAMERHLEDFLVQNWAQTELGKRYDIYEEEGERVGQQYQTDTGPLDILAVSKDKKELLVVELKKGRASDAVVGQTLRYMGYVQEELAEVGQTVKGIIIALDDDQRIRRALSMIPTVDFYRYSISFKLVRG